MNRFLLLSRIGGKHSNILSSRPNPQTCAGSILRQRGLAYLSCLQLKARMLPAKHPYKYRYMFRSFSVSSAQPFQNSQTSSATTPPNVDSSPPEPELGFKEPVFVRPNRRSLAEILLLWLFLVLISLIYSFPIGDLLSNLADQIESDQNSSEKSRKLWRLAMLMGLAGAQLESRGGAVNGRQAIRAAHPELLPTLLRQAKSEDPNVRLAAYAGIAWLFDAYQYTSAHAELGNALTELYPFVAKDLLARDPDHPELTDTRMTIAPWILLLHMAMRDETREVFGEKIVELVNKKAQQLAARDHRQYESSWFVPFFMDQPVEWDSQLVHMIRSQLMLTPRFAQFLEHPANAVTLHNLDSGLHRNSLFMTSLGSVYDRTTVLEREVLGSFLVAVLWGAFRGGRIHSASMNVQGILRSVRMSRGTRSGRASGAASAILGTGTFLLLSHFLAPDPQQHLNTYPSARAFAYWASLLGVAAIPHTALPVLAALQAHARVVPLPPRPAGPSRPRLN